MHGTADFKTSDEISIRIANLKQHIPMPSFPPPFSSSSTSLLHSAFFSQQFKCLLQQIKRGGEKKLIRTSRLVLALIVIRFCGKYYVEDIINKVILKMLCHCALNVFLITQVNVFVLNDMPKMLCLFGNHYAIYKLFF